MNASSKSHIGCVRSTNQDSVLVQEGRYGLYCVADGMGGYRAGDVASRMAVLMLGRVLEGAKPSEDMLSACIKEINDLVYEEQLKNEAYAGMGTTITVLWEDDERVILGHVGDSRAYMLRGGELRQISQDHSLVGEMVRAGTITRDMALVHPYRNIITRAVGSAAELEVDTLSVQKQRGDRWLICSDGLTEHVPDETIARVLATYALEDVPAHLVNLALDGGGRDNVSVVALEVSV